MIFKTLGCLLSFLLIPIALIVGLILKLWLHFRGGNRFEGGQQPFGSRQNDAGNDRDNHRQGSAPFGSAGSAKAQEPASAKKIFKAGEGEYVEYEEVE